MIHLTWRRLENTSRRYAAGFDVGSFSFTYATRAYPTICDAYVQVWVEQSTLTQKVQCMFHQVSIRSSPSRSPFGIREFEGPGPVPRPINSVLGDSC